MSTVFVHRRKLAPTSFIFDDYFDRPDETPLAAPYQEITHSSWDYVNLVGGKVVPNAGAATVHGAVADLLPSASSDFDLTVEFNNGTTNNNNMTFFCMSDVGEPLTGFRFDVNQSLTGCYYRDAAGNTTTVLEASGTGGRGGSGGIHTVRVQRTGMTVTVTSANQTRSFTITSAMQATLGTMVGFSQDGNQNYPVERLYCNPSKLATPA